MSAVKISRRNIYRQRIGAVLALSLSLALLPAAGCGDNRRSNLEAEIAELRAEFRNLRSVKTDLEVVKAELAALKSQSQPQAAADQPIAPAEVKTGSGYTDDPYYGPSDAGLIIIVFSDYQCQSCRQFLHQTFPLLKQDYADPGTARLILRDLPLSSKPHSKTAAALAQCSGEQGRYWEAFHCLLDHSDLLDAGDFKGLIARIEGVDPKRLEQCIKTKKYDREIEIDAADAQQLGARGAPGTFIGVKADSDGQAVYRGVFVRGAQPYEVLRTEISKLLPARP